MTIKRRIQVAFILCALLIAGASVSMILSTQKIAAELEKSRIASDIVRGLFELDVLTYESLLHATPRAKTQWKYVLQEATAGLSKAVDRFQDPAEKTALRKMSLKLKRVKAGFDFLTHTDPETGNEREGRPPGPELKKRLTGDLLIMSQATVSIAFQLQKETQQRLDAAQYIRNLTGILLLVFLAAFFGIFLLWIYRSVGKPIERLKKGMEIVGKGNLDYQTGTAANDEIGQLSRAFDGMTVDLKETTTSIVELNKEITERKHAEEALRESEEKLRNIVEHSTNLFYAHTPEHVLTYLSPQSREFLQCEPEEGMVRWPEFATDNPLNKEGFALTNKAIETGERQPPYELELEGKKGRRIWVEVHETPIVKNSTTVSVVGSLTDITERKQAEESLRRSEAEKKAILDGITTSMRLVNEDLETIWANKAAADSVNKSPEEIVGHRCYEFWGDDPEKPCDSCPSMKTFRTKKTEQIVRHAPDGTIWDLKAEPVFNEKGNLVGVLEIAHDITDKARLEARFHQAQKMESLGLMAGGVAHDLNNILSGIVTYPELLLMDLPEDSTLRRPIKTIQESGMKAVDVVADLLTIVRGVATGKEVLNLNTIVTEYLRSPECRELDNTHTFVDFKTELDPELLNLSGSSTHIKKTLMNLVTNATEAIEGSGTVTISTDNRYLDEPLKGYEDVRQGEYAVLSVSDEGSGISAEDLERIFEPFYTKKVMGRSGTGLGLAIVWNTIQDHKGYINVKSSEKGTVFELYFQVTREEVASEVEEVPLEDYLGHGEKILVVDDEERQREIAGVLLTKLGYVPEAVASGEEAIEYVKEHPVDLIVLDMVMPKGINGRKTYEEIIKIRPGQKAIIASGYAKTREVDLAQDLGAGKYIKKPYTLEKVGLAVKEELEK